MGSEDFGAALPLGNAQMAESTDFPAAAMAALAEEGRRHDVLGRVVVVGDFVALGNGADGVWSKYSAEAQVLSPTATESNWPVPIWAD